MRRPSRHGAGLLASNDGAMAIVALVLAVFLVASLYYLMGIGQALLYRERLQDAADAAAFSSAVLHARGMNLIALINMVMAALMAVLVALKLIELIVSVAIVVVAIASIFGAAAFAGVIPALGHVRQTVRDAHEVARGVIEPTLGMLHVTARGVRSFVPYAAELATIDVVQRHYAPPAELGFAVPTRSALPVENAPYSVLCGKAGGYVATLTMRPFRKAFGGKGNDILGTIEAAVEDLSAGGTGWLCGSGRGSLSIETRDVRPMLPARAACIAASEREQDATALCERADRDEQRSMPDEATGECTGDCDPALYLARVEIARTACDPRQEPTLRKYRWQERRVRRSRAAAGRGQRVDAHEEVLDTRFRKGNAPPCAVPRSDRFDWNTRMHGDDDPQRVLPICIVPMPEAPGVVVEVMHVLQCEKATKHEQSLDGASSDVPREDTDGSKSPQQLEAALALGDEAFQIRAAVLGVQRSARSANVLRVASWGKPVQGGSLPLASGLSRVQVAQAEYYFDGEASADPMWEMRWRARLRRFRMPQRQTPTATGKPADDLGISAPSIGLDAACAVAAGILRVSATTCGGWLTGLRALEPWIVH